jgi:hypothetical protein
MCRLVRRHLVLSALAAAMFLLPGRWAWGQG